MSEGLKPVERREVQQQRGLRIVVLGPTAVGKSTSVKEIGKLPHTKYLSFPEPFNPAFVPFIENPEDPMLAYLNQSHKMYGLALEGYLAQRNNPTADIVLESSVLATMVYNWYFSDKQRLNSKMFDHLTEAVDILEKTFKPDFVAYFYARDDVVRRRTQLRDGVEQGAATQQALHNSEMRPYWDKLVQLLKDQGIPILSIDTSDLTPEEIVQKIDKEAEKVRERYTRRDSSEVFRNFNSFHSNK